MLFKLLLPATFLTFQLNSNELAEEAISLENLQPPPPIQELEKQLEKEAKPQAEEPNAQDSDQKPSFDTFSSEPELPEMFLPKYPVPLLDDLKKMDPPLKEETKKPQPKLRPADKKAKREKEILSQVPDNWYQSTTNLFQYCLKIDFLHPICPQIRSRMEGFDYRSEFFSSPTGGLTPKTLFQATTLYLVGRPPNFWFVSLNLEGAKPSSVDSRLWAEAQWLYGRVLFDQRKLEKSLKMYDAMVMELKGKALVHQQRAWVQFFNGQFDKALGSIVSAESPLIYPVPFFDKYFLRALIERETCNLKDSIDTIIKGRAILQYAQPKPESHPWVILCRRQKQEETCSQLVSWYERIYKKKIKRALDDLELLEIELRDRGAAEKGEESTAQIVWPSADENWGDELGLHRVPVKNNCN